MVQIYSLIIIHLGPSLVSQDWHTYEFTETVAQAHGLHRSKLGRVPVVMEK